MKADSGPTSPKVTARNGAELVRKDKKPIKNKDKKQNKKKKKKKKEDWQEGRMQTLQSEHFVYKESTV